MQSPNQYCQAKALHWTQRGHSEIEEQQSSSKLAHNTKDAQSLELDAPLQKRPSLNQG
jgi:hypothetical protein